MPLLLAVLLAASPGIPSTSPASRMADSTQAHFAQKDVRALRQLLQNAGTRAERFLCRYRLYPLTEDESYLSDLPSDLGAGASAREMALLSGLWGYRAARASLFGAVRAGRRSMGLMKKARAQDPADPLVLLVGGQSLLFRPALAGGSDAEALQRFQRLRDVVDGQPGGAVSSTEAALWTWYALRETNRTGEATALRRQLAARDLPPLYREFLNHPPG